MVRCISGIATSRALGKLLAGLAVAALAACGGGGGGAAPAAATGAGGDTVTLPAAPVSPAPAPAPAAPAPAPTAPAPEPVAPAPAPAPTAPAPAPAPTAPAAVLSQDIAAWGDSLTGPFAVNLQYLYPNRTIYNGGVVGDTSTQIATRELADTEHKTWITTFWYGQNNETDPERIKADIAASVAALAPGNTRFIVLSVVNRANAQEMKGGPDYGTIMQLNSELAATYPQNYLDVRSYLVSQYNPANAQDVADFQNDVPPSSLRFDFIHLNNDGSELVARKVRDFIDARGW